MKIYECEKENGLLSPKISCLNIIDCTEGEIILPLVSKICLLEILFIETGVFKISAHGKDIRLGSCQDNYVTTRPGEVGFDTQPRFLYSDKKNEWFCLTPGLLIYPEVM